jgi:eukaryotic-like serine/threonine-protein kinase
MMAPEHWERVSALYHALEALPMADRRAYLLQHCDGEPAILEEVESLLAAHDAAGTFLERDEPDGTDEGGSGAQPIVPPGTRLGAFEILSWIGAGGMGQVYRARDTRLDRLVALKLLAPDLHADPRLLARFEQEARALSRLTHPHICVLLDVGRCTMPDGTDQPFLVMELVEGDTLAACLTSGRLPLDQALEYGVQIAEALAAAHAHGIVHRDLKPANIMLTRAGVKLLDFGLAGMRSPAARARGDALVGDGGRVDTRPIAGTPPYMAPEQIRGEATDARADLFALGAVLYEMLTGARAFAADSHAAAVDMILAGEPPPFPTTNPPIPPVVARLVRTCLTGHPDNRPQDAQHVALVLRVVLEQRRDGGITAATAPRQPSGWLARTAALLAAFVLLGFLVAPLLTRGSAVGRLDAVPSRLLFEASPMTAGQVWSPHVSPDGRMIAFIGTPTGVGSGFFLGRLDSGEVRPLTTSREIEAGCWGAAWSADGRTLLYFSGGLLRAADVATGAETTLAVSPVPRPAMQAGVARSRDGTVLVGGPRLQRWSAREPELGDMYASPDDVLLQVWPSFLPSGREFLFAQASSNPARQGIYLGSLDSPEVVRVLPVFSNAVVSTSGHLVFGRDGALLAQPFDPTRRAVTGEALLVTANVASDNGYSHFALGPHDTLVYVPPASERGELVWYDRTGAVVGTLGPTVDYRQFVLSPDGRRLAVEQDKLSRPDGPGILILDVTRTAAEIVENPPSGPGEHVAFDTGVDPVWAPDSRRIAFTRVSDGEINLYMSALDASAPAVRIADLPGMQWAEQWTTDDRILYVQSDSAGRVSIWSVALDGDRSPVALVTLPFEHDEPQLSPEGRWLAYVSNQSGRAEVYVQPPDDLSRRWRVSEGGGGQPKWRADGRELFHITLDGTLMVSAVGPDGPGPARPLFRTPLTPDPRLDQYAVAPGGQRFLVLVPRPDTTPARFTVLGHWPALLGSDARIGDR